MMGTFAESEKGRDGLMRETARRLMNVQGQNYTVPSEFMAPMKDSHLVDYSGGKLAVSRWQIIYDFAIGGTGIRHIAGCYRQPPDRIRSVIEDAVHILAEMREGKT